MLDFQSGLCVGLKLNGQAAEKKNARHQWRASNY